MGCGDRLNVWADFLLTDDGCGFLYLVVWLGGIFMRTCLVVWTMRISIVPLSIVLVCQTYVTLKKQDVATQMSNDWIKLFEPH